MHTIELCGVTALLGILWRQEKRHGCDLNQVYLKSEFTND